MQSPPKSNPREDYQHLRHNFTVNLLDGGFFGFALGFASFVTIIPLFISNFTQSAVLIGLIPAVHNTGWNLPQLLTAGWVSRLRRYKPVVMLLTIQERIPFLGLAIVAWFAPQLGSTATLVLSFLLLAWQGLGGGFAGNAWMSMIAKIIPPELRGTFFGLQAAAYNALAAVSAILAGLLLERYAFPTDYSLCFLAAAVSMAVSFVFIGLTREASDPHKEIPGDLQVYWKRAPEILKTDRNFVAFLSTRFFGQMAVMGAAFYIIYANRRFGMDELTAGLITSVFMGAQILANPLMGQLGDRWSHRSALQIGALAALLSALLAWLAPTLNWFYLVFILIAVAFVAVWTTSLTMTVNFARTEIDRPLYIGLSNTLTAPAAILAPLLGGWLADTTGFESTFIASAASAIIVLVILQFFVKDTD
ncbi:MAG: MFS transporter [Anaerolineales bacterium]|nr:MFS transporter [Anaerolineales bacterium]